MIGGIEFGKFFARIAELIHAYLLLPSIIRERIPSTPFVSFVDLAFHIVASAFIPWHVLIALSIGYGVVIGERTRNVFVYGRIEQYFREFGSTAIPVIVGVPLEPIDGFIEDSSFFSAAFTEVLISFLDGRQDVFFDGFAIRIADDAFFDEEFSALASDIFFFFGEAFGEWRDGIVLRRISLGFPIANGAEIGSP